MLQNLFHKLYFRDIPCGFETFSSNLKQEAYCTVVIGQITKGYPCGCCVSIDGVEWVYKWLVHNVDERERTRTHKHISYNIVCSKDVSVSTLIVIISFQSAQNASSFCTDFKLHIVSPENYFLILFYLAIDL